MMKNKTIVAAAVVAVLLVALMGIGLQFQPADVSAAPLAAPTPVSAGANYDNEWIAASSFAGTSAITADTRGTCFEAAAYDVVDIMYIIDQTTTNTTTLKLQFSNDNTNFADGVNIVANNAADATDMQQLQVFGRYTCVYADVTNSNEITITAQLLFK